MEMNETPGEIAFEEYAQLVSRPKIEKSILKQTRYRLFAGGGDFPIEIEYNVMSICKAWFRLCENNPFMRQILTPLQIVEALHAKPSGVLLVGVYDDNFSEPPIRRNPRGYSILWNEETKQIE